MKMKTRFHIKKKAFRSNTHKRGTMDVGEMPLQF